MAVAEAATLEELLADLALGAEPSEASYALLSDLSRPDAGALRSAWPGIPLEVRLLIVQSAFEAAATNVALDFSQLNLVAIDDESADVRAAAACGLEEAPHHDVADRLLRALQEDDDPDVRAAAASSLRQFVIEREFDHGDLSRGDAIVVALRSAFESASSSPALRAAALDALGPRSLPWVADFILDAYNGDDRDLRLASVRAMGDTVDERWLDYLFEQFYSDDPDFRYEAAVASAQIASELAIDPLTQLLEDPDSDVAIAAIAALGDIGGDEALGILKEFRDNATEEYQEAIAEAIEVAAETASGDEDEDDNDDERDDDEYDE